MGVICSAALIEFSIEKLVKVTRTESIFVDVYASDYILSLFNLAMFVDVFSFGLLSGRFLIESINGEKIACNGFKYARSMQIQTIV